MTTIVDRKTRDALADSRKRILRMARHQRLAAKHMCLSAAFVRA